MSEQFQCPVCSIEASSESILDHLKYAHGYVEFPPSTPEKIRRREWPYYDEVAPKELYVVIRRRMPTGTYDHYLCLQEYYNFYDFLRANWVASVLQKPGQAWSLSLSLSTRDRRKIVKRSKLWFSRIVLDPESYAVYSTIYESLLDGATELSEKRQARIETLSRLADLFDLPKFSRP